MLFTESLFLWRHIFDQSLSIIYKLAEREVYVHQEEEYRSNEIVKEHILISIVWTNFTSLMRSRVTWGGLYL